MKRIAKVVGVLLVLAGIGGYWMLSTLNKRVPGETFDSAGVPIFYVDEGPRDADPVILVHGFAANGDINWRAPGIVDALKDSYRVITVDNRGHGLSGKPHNPDQYGIEMVNDIVRLMDHLEIQKAHVVGYSMGAFITLKFITTHPERLLSAMPCGAGWSKPEGANLAMINTLADDLEHGRGFDALVRRLSPGGKEPTAWKFASVNFFLSRINDTLALAASVRGFNSLVVSEEELRKNTVPVRSVVGTIDPLRDGVDAMKDVMANLDVVYLNGFNHITAMKAPGLRENIRGFLDAHRSAAMTSATAANSAKSPAALVPVVAH